MSMMTNEQGRDVLAWIYKHDVHCPVCGADKDFIFDKFLLQLPHINGVGTVRGETTSFVGLTCGKCGYFFMFDALRGGVRPT
jgi:C4-type Zn-finger protein